MRYILVFFIGACFGSFINVLEYRSLRGMDYIFDRSRCPYCHKVLSFLDMIPIISFIGLKGRCRYCKEKISKRYLVTEIVSGINALICYFKFYSIKEMLLYFILLCLLLFVSLRDLTSQEIAYKYQFMILISVIFIDEYKHEFFIKEMIIVFIIFFLIMIISKAIGGADVNLYALLTLLLGKDIIYIYVFSVFIAFGFTLYYLLVKKKDKSYQLSFIPFIYSGYLLFLIFEEEIYVVFYLL